MIRVLFFAAIFSPGILKCQTNWKHSFGIGLHGCGRLMDPTNERLFPEDTNSTAYYYTTAGYIRNRPAISEKNIGLRLDYTVGREINSTIKLFSGVTLLHQRLTQMVLLGSPSPHFRPDGTFDPELQYYTRNYSYIYASIPLLAQFKLFGNETREIGILSGLSACFRLAILSHQPNIDHNLFYSHVLKPYDSPESRANFNSLYKPVVLTANAGFYYRKKLKTGGSLSVYFPETNVSLTPNTESYNIRSHHLTVGIRTVLTFASGTEKLNRATRD